MSTSLHHVIAIQVPAIPWIDANFVMFCILTAVFIGAIITLIACSVQMRRIQDLRLVVKAQMRRIQDLRLVVKAHLVEAETLLKECDGYRSMLKKQLDKKEGEKNESGNAS